MAEGHASRGPTQFDGAPGTYDLATHAKELASRFGVASPDERIVSAATPMMVAGLGSRAIAELTPLFAPLGLEILQAGGSQNGTQTPGAPDHFVDGGSLGVQMARGDVSMFGFGTVTHMEGTRLCGFGHPMMNAGDTAIPAAIARVMWIYASEQHASKSARRLDRSARSSTIVRARSSSTKRNKLRHFQFVSK